MPSLAPSVVELIAIVWGDIPADFWIRIAIGVAAIIAAVVIIRKIGQMNKVILAVVAFVVLTFIGFSWIYERNEPSWATPAVSWLADFFPKKN